MPENLRKLWPEFRRPRNYRSLLLIATAAALTIYVIWQLRQPEKFRLLVGANELPRATRHRLLLYMVLGGVGSSVLSAVLAGLLSAWRGLDFPAALARLAALCTPLFILPLWTYLILLPNISDFARLWLIAAMAAIAYVSTDTIRRAFDVADQPAQWLSRPAWLSPAAVGFVAACYTINLALISVSRVNAMSGGFDLAVFDQSFYNMVTTGRQYCSLEGGTTTYDHTAMHFSPIFYLFAPLYWLFPDYRTLLILQTVALAAAAIPLFLLARRKLQSDLPAFALALSLLLHPALHGVNLLDFHELAFVPLLLLLVYYFIETENWRWFWVCLLLSFACKEELPLTGIAIGAYLLLLKERVGLGFGVMAASACAYVFSTWVMRALGGEPMYHRFAAFIAPEYQGAAGVAVTTLSNPWYIFGMTYGNSAKLLYLLQMLLPTAFTALLRPAALLLIAPALAIVLLTTHEAQYRLGFQYPAVQLPTLYYLAVLGIASLGPPRYLPLSAAILVCALASNHFYGAFGNGRWTRPARLNHVEQIAAKIPPDATVTASQNLLILVTHRRMLSMLHRFNNDDYIFADVIQTGQYVSDDHYRQSLAVIKNALSTNAYGVIEFTEGVILLKRGADPSRNKEVLDSLN